jgi:hypothetical protein
MQWHSKISSTTRGTEGVPKRAFRPDDDKSGDGNLEEIRNLSKARPYSEITTQNTNPIYQGFKQKENSEI